MTTMETKTTPLVLQNYISGAFVDSDATQFIDSFEPATGEVFAKIPDSQRSDVDKAVAAAKAAFTGWKNTSRQTRARIINKIADLIEERLEEFAVAESRDQGKPVSLARSLDIPRSVHNLRFFAGAIMHHEETSTSMDGVAVNYTLRQPVGVCGLISPWNLPLYLLTWKIAPAIACGNTCVCKPSEFTSVTAWMLCDVMQKAGLPPGVVNIVFGTGPNVGQALVEHPDVPLISFTGSTATGERITRSSAPLCKKLSLELGGKNANIIFADANLDDCIPTTVRSSFANQGEICLCGSRIYVHRDIYDTFLQRFVAETRKIVVGDPSHPSTVMGAINTKPHLEKVEYYVKLAVEEGGQIVLGGDKPQLEPRFQNGYWINPTIITGLKNTARCQTEEIFGPVVTVTPFDTVDEVIDMVNAVKYGLSSSVWTSNISVAHNVAERIEAGTVWVNCWMLRDLRVPFGGVKQSGIGREGGAHSIDFYTQQKTVCIKYNSPQYTFV